MQFAFQVVNGDKLKIRNSDGQYVSAKKCDIDFQMPCLSINHGYFKDSEEKCQIVAAKEPKKSQKTIEL